MAFVVELGVCRDPKNKINKTFSGTSYQCTVRDEAGIDIMSPSVLIQTSENLSAMNYARIPDFGRYYYVKSINVERNGLWRVNLAEDVLMSFREEIKGSVGVLQRSVDFPNYYLNDDRMPVTNNTLTWTKTFPQSPFTGSPPSVAYVTILGPTSASN